MSITDSLFVYDVLKGIEVILFVIVGYAFTSKWRIKGLCFALLLVVVFAFLKSWVKYYV